MTNDSPERERVARALCELAIRQRRQWDTPTEKIEAMLSQAVDIGWRDFLTEADAALAALRPTDSGVVEAANELSDRAFRHYRALNGRMCSIEGDDGEACWIIPWDAMADLRQALAATALRSQGQDERAEIVAWARDIVANALWRGVDFADAIEAGRHKEAGRG